MYKLLLFYAKNKQNKLLIISLNLLQYCQLYNNYFKFYNLFLYDRCTVNQSINQSLRSAFKYLYSLQLLIYSIAPKHLNV